MRYCTEAYIKSDYAQRDIELQQFLERDVKMISGHVRFGPSLDRARSKGYKLITLLRDPVERFVSHYNYLQRKHPNQNRPQTLEEFLTSKDAKRLASQYLFYFGQDHRRNNSKEQIHRAINNLSKFALVGDLAQSNLFSSDLNKLVATMATKQIPHTNGCPTQSDRTYPSTLCRRYSSLSGRSNEAFGSMISLLSPSNLVLMCWVSTGLISGLTLGNLERFDLISLFMARENLGTSSFTFAGLAWISLSMLVYFLGDLTARICVPHHLQPFVSFDLELAASIVFLVNLLLIAITCLWIMISATKLDGLFNLVTLAYVDSIGARDLLLSNKLFTGMRLFYAALPATGCMAAAILTMGGKNSLSSIARIFCFFTLGLNVLALFILPMVMSQRSLLFQLLLPASTGYKTTQPRMLNAV